MKIKILLSLALILVVSAASAQGKAAKNEKNKELYVETLNLIESGEFKFVADRALAKGGRTIILTNNPNFLTVKGEDVNAELPFFGEAYSANLSGEGGINVDNTAIDYSIKENEKKLQVEIKFKVKSKTELFNCTLTVYSGGDASLSVAGNQRSSIRYDGKITALNN
jgi:hypothetical protein